MIPELSLDVGDEEKTCNMEGFYCPQLLAVKRAEPLTSYLGILLMR